MITLENIKQKHEEIGAMIAAFESYAGEKITYPAINIDLQPGEKNAGLILGKNGAADYFLILLPEEAIDINWEDAKKWAKNHDGELPTRREQAILFGNLKEEFEEAYYWSCEQHASFSDFAWYQHFTSGTQHDWSKDSQVRARAVRRILVIK